MCITLLASGLLVSAQVNPNSIEIDAIMDEPVEVVLQSAQQVFPQSFDNGYATYVAGPNPGQYTVTIHPDAGFLGELSLVVTYSRSIPTPPFLVEHQTSITVNYGEAIMMTEDDYVVVDSSVVQVLPLLNDSSSASGLRISSVAYVEAGTAVLTDSVTIEYSSPTDDVDLDYVVYATTDDYASSGHGVIYLVKEEADPDLTATLSYTIGNTESQVIRLPEQGMSMSSTPQLGSIESLAGGMIQKYTPDPNIVGIDTLRFNNGAGLSRDVIIEIKDYVTAPLVVDDEVYTAINTPVTFDAWANDNFTGNVVLDWSSTELVNDSLGVFTYTPPAGFQGIVDYEYRVNNGFGIHAANVKIYVGDQAPVNQVYAFATPQDESLILRYEVESDGYTLQIAQNPTNGSADTYDASSVVSIDCNTITGKAFARYTPYSGFTGIDSMVVRFCPANGQCVDYPIQIEVYADSNDDCRCLQGCVWAGDTDRDGRVTVRDVLPIAEALGESGQERSEINYGTWEAQHADDWLFETASGVNMKFADADGDGIVTTEDVDVVVDQYNEVHTLVPTDLLDFKSYPLTLIPHTTDVDSGDLMVVDIVLGNPNFPVENLQGFALGFNINPGFADSASLSIDFLNHSWFAANGPTLDLSQTPKDGRVEGAIGKANGFNANGYGVVAQLSFIVEDEAEGLRENLFNQTRQIKIFTDEQVVTDGDGKMYRLPPAQASVTLHLDREQQPLKADDLIVFPNPVDDQLRLHLNGGRTFSTVRVYDLMGRVMMVEQLTASNGHHINVSSLQPAIYVVEIVTPDGSIATKFVKH